MRFPAALPDEGSRQLLQKVGRIQSASHGLQDCPQILDGRFLGPHEGSNRPGEPLLLQSFGAILGCEMRPAVGAAAEPFSLA